jgi:hypothetical protein
MLYLLRVLAVGWLIGRRLGPFVAGACGRMHLLGHLQVLSSLWQPLRQSDSLWLFVLLLLRACSVAAVEAAVVHVHFAPLKWLLLVEGCIAYGVWLLS